MQSIGDCVDCGVEFEVTAFDTRSDRCEACYQIYRKVQKTLAQKVRREAKRNAKVKSDPFEGKSHSNPCDSSLF